MARKSAAVPTAVTASAAATSRVLGAADPRDRLLNTEWLLTNALGGFAMGTASGVPSRRYHALLTGATKPPVGRIAALNAVAERVIIEPGTGESRSIDLFTFRFAPENSLHPSHPDGLARLTRFEHVDVCTWTFTINDANGTPLATVHKQLQLIDAENACTITYRIERAAPVATAKTKPQAAPALQLRLRPLVSLRDFHSLIRKSWADSFICEAIDSGVRVSRDGHSLHLTTDAPRTLGGYAAGPDWWYNFAYAIDASRGQDHVEDLFSPGEFTVMLDAKSQSVECTIQASFKALSRIDRGADRSRRGARIDAMTAAALVPASASSSSPTPGDAAIIKSLCAAADQFIVARQSFTSHQLDQSSIIAGYPWFADWGRDTSISIQGLMLVTGRHSEARRTLTAFASHRRNGLIPNVFDDRTGEPEFNTVDASLWFIHACCTYVDISGDRATFDSVLAPACLDIITHYRKGTDFNIAMDPKDKLITAGSTSTQLTWMDARRDGVTFTPRQGKAVEINALWYSALRELSRVLQASDVVASANFRELAETVAKSFRASFVNPRGDGLFDCLTPIDNQGQLGWLRIDEIRPNQIFAVSLPHSPLNGDEQRAVVDAVKRHLLTPMGLRTLAPGSPAYRARYEGDLFHRDGAYHNGTAWPWLLGPLAEAVLRVGAFSAASKLEARGILTPIIEQMSCPWPGPGEGVAGCLGQIAEIYDAEPPQRPQGCTAQAWSVAETLRVWRMTL